MSLRLKRALARHLSNLEADLDWHVNTRLRAWAQRLESDDWSAWSWPSLEGLLSQLWTPNYVAGKAPNPRELRALIATRWPKLAEIEVGPDEALLWAVCLVGRQAQRAWWERETQEPRELARLLACLETLEQCRTVARPLAAVLRSPEQIEALREFLARLIREREDEEP